MICLQVIVVLPVSRPSLQQLTPCHGPCVHPWCTDSRYTGGLCDRTPPSACHAWSTSSPAVCWWRGPAYRLYSCRLQSPHSGPSNLQYSFYSNCVHSVESLVPLEGPDTQDSRTDPGPDHIHADVVVVCVPFDRQQRSHL